VEALGESTPAWASARTDSSAAVVSNWLSQIVGLFNQLARIQPSPVVHLNRAVAIAMRDGPEAGLMHTDAALEHGELANYYLAHSARADMYRRLGREPLKPGPLMRKPWH
jgi:RNA polymerase sigma-70 factor, ECF subfamily